MQRVAGVIAHPLAAGLRAQQAMEGAGFGRHQRLLLVAEREAAQRRAEGLGQARRGFTGRRRQANTAARAGERLDQRGQQFSDGRGFTGARTAGNHRNPSGQGDRSRHFLPVRFLGGRKQRVERRSQPGFIHLQHLIGLIEKARDG